MKWTARVRDGYVRTGTGKGMESMGQERTGKDRKGNEGIRKEDRTLLKIIQTKLKIWSDDTPQAV